jgi:tetratricopeptide (TPR) repeat protein
MKRVKMIRALVLTMAATVILAACGAEQEPAGSASTPEQPMPAQLAAPAGPISAAQVAEMVNAGRCADVLRTPMDQVVDAAEAGGLLTYHYGVCNMIEGRHEEAVTLLEASSGKGGPEVFVRYNKGVSLRELGRREEAIAEFEKASALDPGNKMISDALAAARAS